jgi:hypothetical protein
MKLNQVLASILLSASLSFSVTATEIATYLTSSIKGASGVIASQMSILSESVGIKINPIQSVNCGSAVQKFKTATTPSAILMSHNQYRASRTSKQDCIVDDFKSTKILFITYTSNELCVKKGNTIPTGRTATLGVVKINPYQSITDELSNNVQGTKFKYVLFNISTEVVQSLINRDIDVGFVALASGADAIKSDAIECFYSTGSTKFKQRPMSRFTNRDSFVNNESISFMMVVKNLTESDEKKLSESIRTLGDELIKHHLDTTIMLPNANEISAFMKHSKAVEHLD